MEVTRLKGNHSGFDYIIKQDNKVLRIVFGGNLDLYWSLTSFDENKEISSLYDEQYETFLITKENYTLYSLFQRLIDDIKNARVYEPNPSEENAEEQEGYEDIFELDEVIGLSKDYYLKWNEELKDNPRYKKLYNGQDIIWHSDDDYFAEADRVKISELEEAILLEFYRPPIRDINSSLRNLNTISIRFRNSGSTYDPLNIIFMRMFHQLQDYNPDYHQVHLEELNYQKKLKKTK